MCELTNEEMGATHARPRELQPYPGAGLCPRFCGTTGICMWNGKSPAMCPSHTRCRIVSVVIKASVHAFSWVGGAMRRCTLSGAPCNCDNTDSQCPWRNP